jgi:hypothetical protein
VTTLDPPPRVDREYLAARQLLLDSHLAAKAKPYIHDDHIDFAGLMEECYSSSEIEICKAANDIWNGRGGASIHKLICALDERNFTAVIRALLTRRNLAPPRWPRCERSEENA